jgi:glycosyltransferase involved in cell wall biosynthesis
MRARAPARILSPGETDVMKLALTLGGTDLGRSGIGAYVRAVIPHLVRGLARGGGRLLVFGTRAELGAYAGTLAGADVHPVSAAFGAPAPNALWHLAWMGRAAARAGADALLLPAGNRRLTVGSPIPTVAVVHDLAQLHVRDKYDPLRMLYVRRAVVGALAAATALVAVSGATRRDVAGALGRPLGAVRLVPNGVDAARFTPAVPGDPRVRDAMARVGIRPPYLLYLARLEHPGKNHLRLLRAYASSRARAAHALVLAGADWGARDRVRAEIARLGLADRVVLPGYVDDAVVPGLVAGARAVAMVGLHEGFGLPALEALAAGRPVVAARTGALPEVVSDLGASCDPLDEGSIAAAIDRAILDEALAARVAREGPAYARGRDWTATAEGLLDACRGTVDA